MKLKPEVIEALVNLRGNPYFAKVLEGMAEHEKEELEHCASRDGTSLYRAQGAVATLKTWRENYQSAPSLLEKIKQQTNR